MERMIDFKKVKFEAQVSPNCVSTYEGKNESIEDVIKLLQGPRIIKLTVIRMTPKEAFEKSRKGDGKNV
jgi:hypothetical protein